MKFHSTRGQSPPLGFADAFAAGLAPDGGLYVPETLPDITSLLAKHEALSPSPASYTQLAADFFTLFDHDHTPEEILSLCEKSYTSFDAPLVSLDDTTSVLELFHGPTLAFKDFGLQLVGNLFEDQIRRTGNSVNVLGATSGDTGSAAIHGLANKEGVNVFILYPEGRVSPLQERQMTCTGASNIFPISIQGSFDDAQKIVKDLFVDLEFKKQVGLSAINSINLARVLGQCVYYLYAHLQLTPQQRAKGIEYIVPTGNFGNVLAGWLTYKMGLPASKFVVATNQNDLLHRLFTTGHYAPGSVAPSHAPSMDIQVASNFERLLYLQLGRDGTRTAALMQEFRDHSKLDLTQHHFDNAIFTATRTDDAAILENTRAAKERFDYIADPHTACAFTDLTSDAHKILLATASPAKFPSVIEQATGHHPTHPTLEALKEKIPLFHTPGSDAAEVKAFVQANAAK